MPGTCIGGSGGIGGMLPFHQCRRGRCVQVWVGCCGAGSGVVSGVVVVGRVDDGVVVRAGVVECDVVVDGRVVVGPPPPLPEAKVKRPQMMIPIRITTVAPHSASTHGLRNQGRDVSAAPNGSSFAPTFKSCSEKPSTPYGGLLPPTKTDPTDGPGGQSRPL